MFKFRRATKNEQASAMVEFAIVLPMLLLLFVGVVNFGLAFKEKLLIDNAVQTAARTGASIGDHPTADEAILDSIEQGFSSLPDATIVEKVAIFKADGAGDVDLGLINEYEYTGVGCGWMPCATGGSYSGTWNPTTRDVTIDDLDHLGITIYYRHNWLVEGFGIFSNPPCAASDGSDCWTESAVMRLEPVE